MNNLLIQWFVLISLVFNSIKGGKICDFSDIECTTRGAKHAYKIILAAFKDVSPDPIHQEKIEANLEVLKYKLINVTLAGMSNCEVTKLVCRTTELNFDYHLRCPQMILTSSFETEGPLATIPIDGKGDIKIIATDYTITLKGSYGKIEEEQKIRVVIKDYDVEVEPKGKMTFELTNLIAGDKDKFDLATKFLNENWMTMEKLFRKPLIDGLLRKFFEHYRIALRSLPLEDVLPMEEN